MKQHTVLWSAIALLFVLNISTICVMLFRQQPGHGPMQGNHRFDRRVIETLHLDASQEARFERMKRQHHQQMMALDDSMYKVYEQYFALLKTSADGQSKAAMEENISSFYKKKVQVTYQHFAELKAICNPEQQQRFEQLEPFLMQVIAPPPKKD